MDDLRAAAVNLYLNHNRCVMNILAWIILILSILALGLVLFGVAISQRAVNIILLIGLILVAAGMLWGERLVIS